MATALLAQRPPVEGAWDLLAKGDRAGAVRVLNRILTVNASDGEAQLLLGSILFEDDKLVESISHLKEAVRLLPKSADAHYAIGQALNKLGDTGAARTAFEKTIALNAAMAPARVDLAVILLQERKSAAAAEQLDRAIKLLGRDSEVAYPKYLRAKIYTDQEEFKKAEAELAGAVSLRPDFAEAWSDLGQARKTLLDDDGAFEAFARSVQLAPDNAVSQYRLGAEYLRRGNAHEAVQHLEASFRLNPKDQSTLYSLQLALRQDGQPERAQEINRRLREVLHEIDKESQNAFNALRLNNEGAVLEKGGKLLEALEKYKSATALDPAHAGIRTNYAVALLRYGNWREGLAQLREALRRNPTNEMAKAALDDALEQAPPEFGGKGKRPAARKP